MMTKTRISLFFISLSWLCSSAQIGTFTRAKTDIENLIMTNKIRVDEKVSTTVFNYLYPIEKVEIKLDTIIIIAKSSKYKVNFAGEAKVITKNDASQFKTYKTSIFFNYAEYYPKSVKLGNLLFNELKFGEGENLKKFADDIVILRDHYPSEKEKNLNAKKIDSLLIEFSKRVAKFQSTNQESSISEEQRACIVQANLLYDQKQYSKVIELYEKAININPTSYPALYYNLGLIYALAENYQYAIFNMKKYLILDPNAEDARIAQDKINEWKININN